MQILLRFFGTEVEGERSGVDSRDDCENSLALDDKVSIVVWDDLRRGETLRWDSMMSVELERAEDFARPTFIDPNS
jgi:hypothetical protein